MKAITIDELIQSLEKQKQNALLGGDSVVHVCIDEVPYLPVREVKIESDDQGSIALIIP